MCEERSYFHSRSALGVMHQQAEARALAGGRPLKHLQVAVRVAEGGDRAAANVLVDADGFAGLIVYEIQLRKSYENFYNSTRRTALDLRNHSVGKPDQLDNCYRNAFLPGLWCSEGSHYLFLLDRVDYLPVVLHVYDSPLVALHFLERFVKFPNVRLTVIGPLAVGIGVMDEQAEARALAGGRPLQHLQVAVGVAERGDRAAADVLVDADGLALLSSMKFNSGRRTSTGLPSRISNLVLMLLPTTCSGGMP